MANQGVGEPAARRAASYAHSVRVLERTLGVVLAADLFAMMMVTVVDVVGRYFFNAPMPAGYEITSVMMGLSVYFGLPLTTARREHIRIGLLDELFRGRARQVQTRLVDLFCAGALALFAWFLWVQGDTLAAEHNMLLFLDVPLAPFVYAMSVLAGFTVLVVVLLIWLRVPAGEATGVS